MQSDVIVDTVMGNGRIVEVYLRVNICSALDKGLTLRFEYPSADLVVVVAIAYIVRQGIIGRRTVGIIDRVNLEREVNVNIDRSQEVFDQLNRRATSKTVADDNQIIDGLDTVDVVQRVLSLSVLKGLT